MSRVKLRSTAEICADCSVPDPSWVSVNRGILICDECCSVHRGLGRHISQVKSLKKGHWPPSQLSMIHTLYNNGANTIWEHTLLDPSHSSKGSTPRRKPNPKDLLHPTKADFIRAKHQNLSFLHRPVKDSGPIVEDDLHKQLHSSVRTANVETSLRLLTQGADPNYFHPEKGNTPLHIAAKAGQFSQAELLVVYGADTLSLDRDGKTPIDVAREFGNNDLADRIVECQYELTDRLSFYICGRKPDHRSGNHYIIPEMADSLDSSEFATVAKRKLQALPNNLFEELAMDVYDEVDRREIDAIWLSTQNQSALVADRQTVPFLPVNKDFSSTRNQGRQKLARFNAREFATLIIDILNEVKRRSTPAGSIPVQNRSLKVKERRGPSGISDDEPLYDSVASEDEAEGAKGRNKERKLDNPQPIKEQGDISKEIKPSPISKLEGISTDDFLKVKEKLAISESQISLLLQDNQGLKQQMNNLQDMVHQLRLENSNLKSTIKSPTKEHCSNGGMQLYGPVRSIQRPQSMYEPRSQDFIPREDSGLGQTQSSHSSRTSGDYDNTITPFTCPSSSCQQSRSGSLSPLSEAIPPKLPTQQEVIRKTEQITKKIQELLISAQEGNHQSFIPCSEKIYLAVLEMSSIFSQASTEEVLQTALRQLTTSAFRLQTECKTLLCKQPPTADPQFVTQQVITCAYDIAKAAKYLVTLFQ